MNTIGRWVECLNNFDKDFSDKSLKQFKEMKDAPEGRHFPEKDYVTINQAIGNSNPCFLILIPLIDDFVITN